MDITLIIDFLNDGEIKKEKIVASNDLVKHVLLPKGSNFHFPLFWTLGIEADTL